MKRSFVKVARMRIEDVQVGDVVNREPDSEIGWFEVDEVKVLFNGDYQLADRTELITVSGPVYTIVGVQFASVAEVPDQPPSALPPKLEEEPTSDSNEDESSDEGAGQRQQGPSTPAALVG